MLLLLPLSPGFLSDMLGPGERVAMVMEGGAGRSALNASSAV
jgi:hypothetical protein